MAKVKVTPFGVLHFYGRCEAGGCDEDFFCGKSSDMETEAQVRAGIRKHVSETKHSVVLTRGTETLYEPGDG